MVNVWTRSPLKAETLRPASDAFARAIHAYDAMFGKRGKGSDQLWVVECPVSAGCFSTASSNYAKLLLDQTEKITAEMASEDTVMVDLSGETPQITLAAAPALAASWLGYGENPGFFEQVPPLSALPAFAIFRGREELEGQQVRPQTIRKLLSRVPVANAAGNSDDTALRAKSVLFFYSLQDQYGSGLLDAALRHMLQARRGGGFDLDDLIAATEQETHQSVAPFVRLWMKHPGVPAEFRSRYENAPASLAVTSKETE